jgi:hypothetical protein
MSSFIPQGIPSPPKNPKQRRHFQKDTKKKSPKMKSDSSEMQSESSEIRKGSPEKRKGKGTKRKKTYKLTKHGNLKEGYGSDVSSDISESENEDEYLKFDDYIQLNQAMFESKNTLSKFNQGKINVSRIKAERVKFKQTFDKMVQNCNSDIAMGDCMKLISSTHGSVDLTRLAKRIPQVYYNAVIVAKQGCINASLGEFSTVYTPVLMEYSKAKKTIFTQIDRDNIKRIIEEDTGVLIDVIW